MRCRNLCPHVEALIANHVCGPVPEADRRAPIPEAKILKAKRPATTPVNKALIPEAKIPEAKRPASTQYTWRFPKIPTWDPDDDAVTRF
jgi:hypothetical protein